MIVLVLAGGLAAVEMVANEPPAAPGTVGGHRQGHVGCPPGSHGELRTAGVGQRLTAAHAAALASRPIKDRALVAQ